MISASSQCSISFLSGFGCLLLADPTYHRIPPTHPQTASPIAHLDAAGLRTGWQRASRCHRKEHA